MAWYSEEAWDYIQDCKEKKFTGGSARSKRGHAGKRGGMKTASDYMTKKELRALDGEVKTYRLGSPMSWEEFNAMPDDLKKMYIKNLRKKFNVPDEVLAVSMGGELTEFAKCLKTVGLSSFGSDDWGNTDDCGRFGTWFIATKEEK